MKIDSHQHFWRYSESEYPWISPNSPLHHTYLPSDLKVELDQSNLDGCIAVQARQSLKENDFLTQLAVENDFVKGIIGWIDLQSSEAQRQAEAFKQMPKAVGVRHVVQDESDPEFMARASFRRGIAALKDYNLIYDILIYEHQLPDAIRLVEAFPDQCFVLDHIAKPKIRHKILDPWRVNLRLIAQFPNVSIKLSGILTEADHSNWRKDQLQPYWEHTLESFGASRILFGSDWPVIRLAGEYANWVQIVTEWLEPLTPKERKQIWGENAMNVYRIQ